MENICKFQMAFSQWRAGLRKKSFWDVFLRLASFVFMKNFRFLSPALHVLSKKMPIFYHICVKKYFSTKIFTVLHQSKKELLDLDQNWAKTRHLLFKTWKSSISMDSPIVHCEMCVSPSHTWFLTKASTWVICRRAGSNPQRSRPAGCPDTCRATFSLFFTLFHSLSSLLL